VNRKSPLAEQTLKYFCALCDIERELQELDVDARCWMRQIKAKPISNALDYSLRRRRALTRCLGQGTLPPYNNHVENQMRPVALGRSNWLFVGSLRAWPARCHNHELDPMDQAQRAGSRIPA